MKRKFTLSEERKRTIFSVATSIVSMAVLFLSLTTLNYLITEEGTLDKLPLFLFGIFAMIAASRVLLVFKAHAEKDKFEFVKNIVLASIYFIQGLLYFFLPKVSIAYGPLSVFYLLTLAANRICLCFQRRKVSSYIFNGSLALILLLLGISTLFSMNPEEFALLLILDLTAIMIVSLIDTLTFALSRMKLKGIMKIMRKTYAFEIFYGFIVLILSCSYYFTLMESGINSYGDALWYSFAVVTTIGFGDFTVTSTISRILSVILGFYGVIVVAVLTSIIVNFYNDTKDSKSVESPKEESKESLEEPEQEETPKE